MITLAKRIFRAGWHGLTRDGGMMLANVFIMTMAISVVTSLFIFKDVSQFMIANIQEKVDVSVYFKYDTSEDDILNAKETIAELPEVTEITYVSRDDALEKFIYTHKDNPVLMESLAEVGTNPFLASLGIRASQASQYEAVVYYLENSNLNYLIEKIDYYQRKPVIERIYNLSSSFNRIGLILSLLLIMAAVLVAFNAVRLSIYNSREEIKIQKLVGASNWFVRGPFLVQGAICGFFAALISLLLFTLLAFGFNSQAAVLFPDLHLFTFFMSSFWMILLVQLLTGVVLGVVSGLVAVRRYLKV
ncbi:MAG TPA: permease-like cell division protein FtsX [Candidatus Paceibacterota bacterium]|nr:permease-like cell division protein FtsX [Candidatus Paceibacterota bacterium]